MFGRVVPLEPFDQPSCLGRRKGLVQRRWLVGIEVVLNENDLGRAWKVLVGQLLKEPCVIQRGMAVCDLDMPPAFQGSEQHEQIGGAVALILIIMPCGPSRLRRDRQACLGDQLFRCLVQAHDGVVWIMGPMVHFQNIFHGGNERGTGVGWNDPLFF